MLSLLKYKVEEILLPLTRLAVKSGLKPNHISLLGFIFGIAASVAIAVSELIAGVILLALSSFMDVFDGAMARGGGKETEFGGFLDSVFDRYVDIAIFTGLGIYAVREITSPVPIWPLVIVTLAGAMLVSYTRARAEHAIPNCDVGVVERGERIILIVIALITGFIWQILLIIGIFSHITAVHRVLYTYIKTR